jgi:hypothetical protein
MPHSKGNVLHGARARFSLNGVKQAYTTSISFSEEFTQEAIKPIDQLETAEHVTTDYMVTLSCQWVRVVKNSIKNRDGVLVLPTLRAALTSGELTGTIEDSVTEAVIATIIGVKASRYTISIGSRGVVMTDVDFVARMIQDESEIV